MHEFQALKDKLMAELKKYSSRTDMSASTLDVVDKLTHTIKNLCKIMEDGEYSEAMPMTRTMYGRSYDDGMGHTSYAMARGRGRNARRDAMGRYSSTDIVGELRELAMDAPDDKTRSEIEMLVRKMETM